MSVNRLHREHVEYQYARLYDELGLDTTTRGPVPSGLLPGEFSDGIPKVSRANLKGYECLADGMIAAAEIATVKRPPPIATELVCTLAQISDPWCLKNPRVSTVTTSASRPAQLVAKIKSLDVMGKLVPKVMARIAAVLAAGRHAA